MSEKKTTWEKVYEHTFAERVVKNDFFQGEFINNEVAAIYPRRDALVKDILVDIGDTVEVWQTLALLFEPGVEWQASSSIALKSTLVQAKNNLLGEAQKVKNTKVAELDTKIQELGMVIAETEKNFDAKIAGIGDINNIGDVVAGNELQIEIRNLEILQADLKTALASREVKLRDSQNNIDQKAALFETKVGEIFSQMIALVYIGNEHLVDYEKVDKSDLHYLFGAMNASSRTELVSKIRSYQLQKSSLDPFEKSDLLISISPLLITALENTVVGDEITEAVLTAAIASANSYGSELILQKESYEDAVLSHQILQNSEAEKIANLESKIEKQLNVVALVTSKLNIMETDKSLQLEKLKAQLLTMKKSRDLLIASEDQNLTGIRNDLWIARADLNKEYVASGDYKILSPFSGTVSKRNIQIGEKASSSIEAFRIAGVDNSLSRVTKKEIKFLVPESLQVDLQMDKEVMFTTSDNAWTQFTWTIYRISPEIDPMTRTITVQAKVDESISLPNMTTVRVNLETEQAIFQVPTSSIYNKGERKIMYYKKDNGKLGVQDINIISDDGEFSLVTGDFDESLKVVTTPIFVK